MDRRSFLIGAAAAAVAKPAFANVPTPYDWSISPPRQSREAFVEWMVKNRGEDPRFLGERWDRLQQLISHRDIWDETDIRAYLMTPREDFVTPENLDRAYEWHHLNIGFGVTITGPHTVARMTNTLAVRRSDKVLEIGTGCGYQVRLSREPHAERLLDRDHPAARKTHARSLRPAHRRRLQRVSRDPHEECRRLLRLGGVRAVRQDHRHLRHRPHPAASSAAVDPGGDHGHSGRPSRRAARDQGRQAPAPDGSVSVVRSDIYGGAIIPFVPFTGLHPS